MVEPGFPASPVVDPTEKGSESVVTIKVTRAVQAAVDYVFPAKLEAKGFVSAVPAVKAEEPVPVGVP